MDLPSWAELAKITKERELERLGGIKKEYEENLEACKRKLDSCPRMNPLIPNHMLTAFHVANPDLSEEYNRREKYIKDCQAEIDKLNTLAVDYNFDTPKQTGDIIDL